MTDIPDTRGEPEIVLDISRLLSRVMHATPTGVDRCEMAYARGLLDAVPAQLSFAAFHPAGFHGRLPTHAVHRFLDATEERWERQGYRNIRTRYGTAAQALLDLRPRLFQPRSARPRIYVQASPSNLTRPSLIARILRRENARFVCLVHDLIPLEFPEYARVNGAHLHRRRVETIANHAAGIITNSHATLASLEPWLRRAGRSPKIAVAHLGTHSLGKIDGERRNAERPYFLHIGTIEPRKNHLLLLHMWRKMSETRGADAIPKLLLVGRRGWENEQVVDMLERCPALRGCVEELPGLSDNEVQAKLLGARALLLPSFAEGYGMPVAEALRAGTPVICSELPALREAGGDVPEFLDPLDGAGWLNAIQRYAEPGGSDAQLERLKRWHAPTWQQHIAILLQMVHGLAVS